MRPPSSIQGKVPKPVNDYFVEIYSAITSLVAGQSAQQVAVKKLATTPVAAPPANNNPNQPKSTQQLESSLASTPPALTQALGLEIIDLSREVTGILPVGNGGTGSSNPLTGTYTPTLFNDANLTSSTPYVTQWVHLGNMVTVSGKVTVKPTALATYTELGVSLPIASTFTANQQCGGAASSLSAAGPNQSALVGGDTTNHRAIIAFGATDTGAQDMFFSFTYQVL